MGAVAQKKALDAALDWLRSIADDDRNGRSEIAYDKFAYKRRERELQDAARKALAEIKKILSTPVTKRRRNNGNR